jgi:hypothetical protein
MNASPAHAPHPFEHVPHVPGGDAGQTFCMWGYRFCIDRALALLGNRPPNNRLVIADCLEMLRGIAINEQHALSSDIDLTKPVIMVWFPAVGAGMVIDGWHRIWRAAMEGLTELPCHLLTLEETDHIRVDNLPPLASQPGKKE